MTFYLTCSQDKTIRIQNTIDWFDASQAEKFSAMRRNLYTQSLNRVIYYAEQSNDPKV